MNMAGNKLERDFDILPRLNIPSVVLTNLRADDRARRIDESHDRCERKVSDPRALAQSEVSHISIGRRADDCLVEVPLRARELPLELINIGLPLLHVEGTSSRSMLQFCNLR